MNTIMMACATGCPLKVSGMMMHEASTWMYSTVNIETATCVSRLCSGAGPGVADPEETIALLAKALSARPLSDICRLAMIPTSTSAPKAQAPIATTWLGARYTAHSETVEHTHRVPMGMLRLRAAKSTRNSHSPRIMKITTSSAKSAGLMSRQARMSTMSTTAVPIACGMLRPVFLLIASMVSSA